MAFISPLGLLRISAENGEAHIKPQGRTAARSRITLGDFGRIELTMSARADNLLGFDRIYELHALVGVRNKEASRFHPVDRPKSTSRAALRCRFATACVRLRTTR